MLVHRAENVRHFLDSATMLEMATIGGARALKLDDKIGSLEIGKLADIIAVDLSGSHQTPTTDPVSAVVNTCSGADILMTMVNGTALYEKNKWKSERIRAAQERERKEKERREAAARTKKIFTIVVCVILVLALGIPTVALAFLGNGS